MTVAVPPPVRHAEGVPYVDARDCLVHWDETGEGEAVLFLHGGFCSAEVMRPLSRELAGYRVVAPERPGHGRTADRQGDYHYADGVADTLAVMDALALDRPHVVGFSDGAIIGMMLALERPDRIRSLVLIGGNLRPDDDVFDADGELTDEEADATAREYAELSPDGADHASEVEAKLARMWATEPQIDPAALSGIRMPVLVMAGDRDVIARDHTALIHRSTPGALLEIVPGSHLVVRERPDLVGPIVQRFLDEQHR